MNYKALLLSPVSMLLFACAHGQNSDDWDTYMAKFGDKPGSVLVNMGLYQAAPDSKYPYLVVTGPKVQDCNKDGLPAANEIGRLEEILDATDNFLTGVTAKVLAGTLTYNCERVNYYYVKDTAGIRFALTRLYNRSYPSYNYAIHIKKEPDWLTYRTFLYPDEQVKNWMESNKVITKMLLAGDSLKDERKIEFELYFRTDTDRAAVVTFATARGYKAEELKASESQMVPYELILSKRTYIKTDLLGAMTGELKGETKRRKGFYNGWKVVK